MRQQKVRRRPAREGEVGPVSEEPPPAEPASSGTVPAARLLQDIAELLSHH